MLKYVCPESLNPRAPNLTNIKAAGATCIQHIVIVFPVIFSPCIGAFRKPKTGCCPNAAGHRVRPVWGLVGWPRLKGELPKVEPICTTEDAGLQAGATKPQVRSSASSEITRYKGLHLHVIVSRGSSPRPAVSAINVSCVYLPFHSNWKDSHQF